MNVLNRTVEIRNLIIQYIAIDNSVNTVTFTDVQHVPDFNTTLISTS
jgi:hypothetical protein